MIEELVYSLLWVSGFLIYYYKGKPYVTGFAKPFITVENERMALFGDALMSVSLLMWLLDFTFSEVTLGWFVTACFLFPIFFFLISLLERVLKRAYICEECLKVC